MDAIRQWSSGAALLAGLIVVPFGVDLKYLPYIEPNADFREDSDRQDDHSRRRELRHDSGCQGKDPGQGGHPPGSAAPNLRRQAARGWTYHGGLQYSEGVNTASRAPAKRWVGVIDHVVSFMSITSTHGVC